MTPLEHTAAGRDELIASGQLRPGRGNVLDVQPVQRPEGTPDTAELLAQLRDER